MKAREGGGGGLLGAQMPWSPGQSPTHPKIHWEGRSWGCRLQIPELSQALFPLRPHASLIRAT